jgi:hypothetical protein
MTRPTTRTLTRPQQIAHTLVSRGHVSEATGQAEYGRMHVGRAIWQLRNTHSHLLPQGSRIVSNERKDSNGNRYVEWQLQLAGAR